MCGSSFKEEPPIMGTATNANVYLPIQPLDVFSSSSSITHHYLASNYQDTDTLIRQQNQSIRSFGVNELRAGPQRANPG